MKEYNPQEIEKKWQEEWEKSGLYKTPDTSAKPKFYILDMFPYVSGEGIHVGHPKGYIATDVVSRMKRMQGFNVLHPMGFDAFGLPTENYAIKTKTNPKVVVKQNIEHFKEQLSAIGFDYDWSREISTTDPEFYKWTQWIFLKLLEKGLAYESSEPVNWCPFDKTVLANEDVEGGKCERCGTVVEKKPIRQWVLKITDYADRLLNDLDATDYEMPLLVDKVNPHKPGAPLVKRHVAHAIVYNPVEKKYLIIRNKKFGWDTMVIGGIEGSDSVEETARREVEEETGYTDLEFKRILGGPTEAHYHTPHKGENRIAIAQAAYFELRSDKRAAIQTETMTAGEVSHNEVLWVDEKDFVPGKLVNSELSVWLERLQNPNAGVVKPLLDWPESIKEAQRNWIGRSYGMQFSSPVKDTDLTIETFNSHFEAFSADTFVVIAPDHKLLPELVKGLPDAEKILDAAKKMAEKRNALGREVVTELEGIFTGRYTVDPVGNGELPIWIANYALADYGTGIVKSSAHDERDFNFAKKYGITLKPVLFPEDSELRKKVENLEICYSDMKNGILAEPQEFHGRKSGEVREEIIAYLEKNGLAKRKTTYRLRDWVFSRQRYWGEPIPVLHDGDKVLPISEQELPLVLPDVESYEPTGTAESPLANIPEWINVKVGDKVMRRESNTMPQWAGSSWYYLRFMDPHNNQALVDKDKEKYWNSIDLYVGGAEHAARHLIYARFWHKFLYDIGVVTTKEPFKRLQHVGLIMAEDGRKMSKRWGNIVNPDDIIAMFGADSLRLYEMFMGPFAQSVAWSTNSISGVRRFLERVWKLREKIVDNSPESSLLHPTTKKVSEDIEAMRFNTAISTLMIYANQFEKDVSISHAEYETLLKLVAPFAPHMAEELWHELGHTSSIHVESWPGYDESKLVADTVTIVVQVDGKVRSKFTASSSIGEAEALERARTLPEIAKWVGDKEPIKKVFIPGKLVNFVLS